MTNSGIKTKYNHLMFRSRLEAQWAVFFDLLEWQWEYEPFDLDGWVPDFVIRGATNVLVEVKPVHGENDPLMAETRKKIEAANTPLETLICSYFLPDANEGIANHDLGIGWLDDTSWAVCPFQDSMPIGFFHPLGSFRNRITGDYDGDHYASPADEKLVRKLWAQAKNVVQWKPANPMLR